MTLRLTFGIDPGIAGAIASLIDGEPGPILDMPTYEFKDQSEVDARVLARFMRETMAQHPGAYVSACIERVRAMPAGRNADGSQRKQGGQTMFVFGDNYGKPKAALEILGIPYTRAEPTSWKRHYGLIGQEKDEGRLLAIRRFPEMADQLKRKKDGGRADALLIALWHESTQMIGARAAA
jgi:hypothetical protein